MTTWYVDVDFIVNNPLDTDSVSNMLESLDQYGAYASTAPDSRAGSIALHIDATDAGQASIDAQSAVLTAMPTSAEPTVIKIDVRTEEELDAELLRPTIPPLVSLTEAGAIAGISRQRVRQLSDRDDFPRVAVTTASGPLYLKSEIRDWAESRDTRSGRPRVNA